MIFKLTNKCFLVYILIINIFYSKTKNWPDKHPDIQYPAEIKKISRYPALAGYPAYGIGTKYPVAGYPVHPQR